MPIFFATPDQKFCSLEKSFPDIQTISSFPITFSHSTVFPILEGPTMYVRYPSTKRLCLRRSSYVYLVPLESLDTYVLCGYVTGLNTSEKPFSITTPPFLAYKTNIPYLSPFLYLFLAKIHPISPKSFAEKQIFTPISPQAFTSFAGTFRSVNT